MNHNSKAKEIMQCQSNVSCNDKRNINFLYEEFQFGFFSSIYKTIQIGNSKRNC